MKSIFDLNNPFMQFLTRVGDMILLNFLFLICCIPLVTVGAARAALYKVTIDAMYDMEGGIFKSFFAAFRANFKQATVVWLIQLVIFASLVCDVLLILTFMPTSKVMYILVAVLGFLVLCVIAYMTPLLVRYDNSLREHLSNAIVLAIIKLPKTLGMVILNTLPLLIAVASLAVFAQTLVFWMVIGFAFVAFLNCTMLKSVFAQLEKGNNKVTVGM